MMTFENKPKKNNTAATRPSTPSSLPVFHYNPPLETPELIYSDNEIVIVNKPAQLLSVPGARPGHQDCLVRRVQKQFPSARIVHRLDMDTSGLMVLALDAASHRILSMHFERRNVEKLYHALVIGHPEKNEGTINLPLIADWPNRPKQKVDKKNGKTAETHYKIVARTKTLKGLKIARMALYPKTGRSHQLRVHMFELGHPILGDVFYANKDALKASERLCLHASRLSFNHPVNGEWMVFQSKAKF